VANWRSSGVATAEAMVSGLAPGSEAFTWRVGKSTLGKSLTGKARYPAMPNNIIPIMTKAVITGRLIKISVIFMGRLGPQSYGIISLMISRAFPSSEWPNGGGKARAAVG